MQPLLSRLSLKQKLALFASLPMLIILLLGAMRLNGLFAQYHDASSNVLITRATLEIQNLVYELQKERGLSAAFLNSKGQLFVTELRLQKQKTDQAIQQLLSHSTVENAIQSTAGDSILYRNLQQLFSRSNQLQLSLLQIRAQVLSLSQNDPFLAYSTLNQKLIRFIASLRLKSDNSDLIKPQADLIQLLEIQELSAQERGLINQLLSSQDTSTEVYKHIINIHAELNRNFEMARSNLAPSTLQAIDALLDGRDSKSFSAVLQQIHAKKHLISETRNIANLIGYEGLNRDLQQYLQTFDKQKINQIEQTSNQLLQILASIAQRKTLTDTEREQLGILKLGVKDYQQSLNKLKQLQGQNQAVSQLTNQLLQQEQNLYKALTPLRQHSPLLTSAAWWNIASLYIDGIHGINTKITQQLKQLSIQEKNRALFFLGCSLFIGLGIFYVVFLIGKNIATNLINNVSHIVNSLDRMRDNPNLELNLAIQGKDEISKISVALNQMLHEKQIAKRELNQALAVFNHSSEGIVVTNAQNRIELVNPAFTRITGYQPDEVKGKKPTVLNSTHHRKDFYDELWRSVRETGNWEGEIWNKRKDGQVYPEYLAITAVRDEHGNIIQHIGLFRDISNNKQYEQDIWYKTNYDSLTKLPNRHLFSSRLQQQIERSSLDHTQIAILFINVDKFKQINQMYGRVTGNTVLQKSATRLESILGRHDSIARVSGDEFVIIAPQYDADCRVDKLANDLNKTLSEPFTFDDIEISISSCFGIAFYPENGTTAETLLRNAESAMYQAKKEGPAHYKYFSPDTNAEILERIHLEQRLHKAINQTEFKLQYQPIIEMKTGYVSSVEALIRWHDPQLGIVAPDKFIPIAEETGLIEALGEWILHRALTDLAQLHARGFMINMALNVSGRQFINSKGIGFYQALKAALVLYDIDARYVHIEITETMLIEDSAHCMTTLNSIKQLGVDIYLDDFGTGYSALSYLKKFPISVIKIDKSFIDNALESHADANLVKAIIMMGQSLEMPLVAEGIESMAQWEFLQDLGCDYAQGYLMSRPLDKAGLLNYLEQNPQTTTKAALSAPELA